MIGYGFQLMGLGLGLLSQDPPIPYFAGMLMGFGFGLNIWMGSRVRTRKERKP